jgi:hypothetical protein
LRESAEEAALGWPDVDVLEKAVQRLRGRLAKCSDPSRRVGLLASLEGCESALRDARDRVRLIGALRGSVRKG